MKGFFLGILVVGSISVQASVLKVNGPLEDKFFEAEVTQDKSYYETLGDLFSNGTLPSISKISNIAWSGRCFRKINSNKPLNAGYIIRKKRTVDVGPLDQSAQDYEVFSYWSYGEVPSFFDNMSIKQVFEWNPDLISMDAKINSTQITAKLSGSGRSNLKISGSYLIEEITEMNLEAGPLAESSIEGRCYYFMPDLNK